MRRRRTSTARHWALALLAAAASIGGGALIGSETASGINPFYRYAEPRWRAPPPSGLEPTGEPPPIAYAPVRAPDFALSPPDPYDDPAPESYGEPAWPPPPLEFDAPMNAGEPEVLDVTGGDGGR